MTVTTTDLLRTLPPRQAAEHAHLEALLRCWLRETGVRVQAGPMRIPLPRSGMVLHTEVLHRSATDWHRFGAVRLGRADEPESEAAPADPVLAVALVAYETGTRIPDGELADLVERTAESVRRVTTNLANAVTTIVDGFLDAEQALLLGHLHHPAPKSRDGISDNEAAAYSPEARGSFQLHWFAADPGIVSYDAVTESPSLGGHDAVSLLAELAGGATYPGRVLIPAHPWQGADLLRRPRIAALIADGRLEALGPLGLPWWPTSSLRTVYRPDSPVMLKLSLGLRLTNSRRESTRTELRRGLEIDRVLAAGYADTTFAAYPSFSIVRDPAWIAVDEPDAPGGPRLTGLDVAVREVPGDVDDLRCLAGLVAPRPGFGRSRLGSLVAALGSGAAADWVAAYADKVLVPMLHLYAATGIGLEAHQQNTLVRLGADGRVVGGAFRDNQGYYLAASHLPGLLARTGADTSTLAVVEDSIVDDRLCYYLLRNQALAVIGCLAVDGLAEEPELLAILADRLRASLPALAAAGPGGHRLAQRWLHAETLPCKANLLTRLHGIDEVTAPLDAQSVYLDMPNPLREASR